MENIEKIIYYDGIKFILHESKKYHYNSTLRRHLHQYIWEKAHGAIPKGWEVHHKDLNVNNNDLDNLEAMPAEEHRVLHSRINKETGRNREARIKNLEEKARPKACEWHGSEAGIEWHKEQYKKTKDKLHAKKQFVCDQCGESFEAINNGVNRFCSNKCKSAWRRKAGLDDIIKICEVCGSDFKSNKYNKSRTCSRSCANRLRAKNK